MRTGLTNEEAARRLAQAGPNELQRQAGTPRWKMFLRQFEGALVLVLVAATALSAVLGEVVDAVAIGVILVVNAAVGYLQESRAEKAMLALRSMTAPRATVIREGRAVVLPARDVVPGDVLLLEAGDVVAADARLVEAHALTAAEAALTGESAPVEKRLEPAPGGAPLAERHDTVFMGTSIATGTAVAEVTATGMSTELGRIAHLIATAGDGRTPLQDRLERVGRTLLVVCVVIVAVVATVDLLRGTPWLDVLMSAVSLAVGAVPEGLAATVTVALAIGVQRMAARHVLVRRLPAVETLGSTSVICTDKTGTLTTGVMTVREVWAKDERSLFEAAAANCDAELGPDGRTGRGDPTEVALLAAAALRGITREAIERQNPRVEVTPFDTNTRRMSIRRADGELFVKGAVESVLPLCSEGTAGALEENAAMASRGLRVLAIARGTQEGQLRLVGLTGIADPPRTEAIDAVAQARRAGIVTVMITGDHPATANAIAREMGILLPGEDPAERVHARATAADKLEIVRRLKAQGAVVAMTGDGVNDAPALKEAHIGIAMGKTGTEVTREASAMVLTDDNYASIVAAVQEGRGIYDNIRKTLVYLLSGNATQLLLMLVAALLGLPLPLLPLQILWINLVTETFPALALVTEPTEADVLERPPRPADEPTLGREQLLGIALTTALQCALVLGVYLWALSNKGVGEARNLAFSTLVFSDVLRAFAARSTDKVYWEVGVFSNVRLLAVVLVAIGLQLAVQQIPLAHRLFGIDPLSLSDGLLALALGLVPVTLLELGKVVKRRGPGARQLERRAA